MRSSALVPSDLFQVFEPIFLISKIGGFLPVTSEQKSGKILLKRSLKLVVYSYFLAAALMVLSMVGLTDGGSPRMRNPNLRTVLALDLAEITWSVFLTILTSPSKLGHFWTIMVTFAKIDEVLPPREQRGKGIWLLTAILAAITGLLVCDLVIWGLNSADWGTFCQKFIPLYLMYFLAFVQELPFCFFAYQVELRLRALNRALPMLLGRLSKVMIAVEGIEDGVDAINDFCGVHTLLVLISCLFHLVLTPYFLLVELCGGGYAPFIILQMAWLLAHLGRLIVMVETCQGCMDEYQRTVNLVLKLLTSQMESTMKDQLHVLAVQVSTKKIRFSAFGMVKIGRSLLTAFGGSVTTFLVILFQYGGGKGNIYVQ